MPQEYSFTSHWLLPVSVEECWARCEAALMAGEVPWWPAVGLEPRRTALAPGDIVHLRVRSPWGYRLRVVLTVTDLVPARRLAAVSGGDLVGKGSLHLAPASAPATGARLTWVWEVSATRRWMRLTAPVLRPVFAAAHTLIMRRGERGLIAHLTRGSDVRKAGNRGGRALRRRRRG
ncbi:hypothetical protein [Microbacterium hominis]|uniref:SRPBCC family protein n=1 Tax=Microbacterium hominis TaxID=162426 RepID=A0A0B4CLQ2_9MICO|nr:hypothetical protein [Microbacterium hominis]KIC57417.1 hypothetical protein RM52_10390 [Microbacterium hominis]